MLGVLLALALCFACAVMVAAMSDIAGTPTCHDISAGQAAIPSSGECLSGSSLQKAITLGIGWPSGVIAGLGGLVTLAFAITGRLARLALVLGGLRSCSAGSPCWWERLSARRPSIRASASGQAGGLGTLRDSIGKGKESDEPVSGHRCGTCPRRGGGGRDRRLRRR